jgi:riboflavin kinase/FMN adenylyltransferase
MCIYRDHTQLPREAQGGVIAVGNFDGVHLGHREVIGEAGRIAKACGQPWGVLTLEPHPRRFFHPDAPPFRLTPFPAKARLIEALGPDFLVVARFDADFARLTPRSFVEQALVAGLDARHVVCGHDFAFGHGRRGTCEMLLWLADEFDFGFTCVPEVRDADGEPYSSTRIRGYLRDGQPQAAARLLGRPFEIEGTVIEGDHRGRSIGFPTANIPLDEYAQPMFGVYAVRALVLESGRRLARNGVSNLGIRPTFEASAPLLESHLFDFDGDLYGRTLRVQLIEHLRAEKKFDGLDALRAQITDDCAVARRLLDRQAGTPRARFGTS